MKRRLKMSVHKLIASKFIYANPAYSISSLDNIKDFIYRLKSRGTVYNGTQAHYCGFRKSHIDIYDLLAEKIYKYLNDGKSETSDSFDKWHEETCESLLVELRKVNRSSQIGLAQKFINLALKYAYCCKDAYLVDRLHKFDYCHVALDQYTYWPNIGTSRTSASYIRKIRSITLVGTTLTTPFYTEMVNSLVPFSNLVSWRNLSYHSTTTIGYYDIQKHIRAYISGSPIYSTNVLNPTGIPIPPSPKPLTPFQVEFLLW